MNAYTLTIRPNEELLFPNICVHCARPAHQTITIRKQAHQRLRTIKVPLCNACNQQIHRKSGVEEQRLRLGLFLGIGLGVITFAIGLLFSATAWLFVVRLFFGLLIGVVVGTAVYLIMRQFSQKASLPEKQTILNAAKIQTFDHNTTTFTFYNQTFAERFIQLNESQQMKK